MPRVEAVPESNLIVEERAGKISLALSDPETDLTTDPWSSPKIPGLRFDWRQIKRHQRPLLAETLEFLGKSLVLVFLKNLPYPYRQGLKGIGLKLAIETQQNSQVYNLLNAGWYSNACPEAEAVPEREELKVKIKMAGKKPLASGFLVRYLSIS